MALTKEFKETVTARAKREPAFREALRTETVEQLLGAELDRVRGDVAKARTRPDSSDKEASAALPRRT